MFLLFFLVVVTHGAVTCDRARILSCTFQYLDTDSNGSINATEINNFMLNQPCGHLSSILSAERFFNSCDTNADNLFTAVDYDSPLSCFKSNGIKKYICLNCDRCDSEFAKKKKKKSIKK